MFVKTCASTFKINDKTLKHSHFTVNTDNDKFSTRTFV